MSSPTNMKPEARQKFLQEQKEYDNQFRAVLLRDIPYFHALYKKYHDPKALGTAQNLGKYLTTLKKRKYDPT